MPFVIHCHTKTQILATPLGKKICIHTSDREDAINIFDGPFQKFRQVLDSLLKSTDYKEKKCQYNK